MSVDKTRFEKIDVIGNVFNNIRLAILIDLGAWNTVVVNYNSFLNIANASLWTNKNYGEIDFKKNNYCNSMEKVIIVND